MNNSVGKSMLKAMVGFELIKARFEDARYSYYRWYR